MKVFKVLGAFVGVVAFAAFLANASVVVAGEFSGTVKSVDTATNTIVITTGDGDKTFTANKNTKVNITDVDGAKTKADIGSLMTAAKDGAGDSVVLTDNDKGVAKKVDATTTRRMTLTKEEIKAKTLAIVAGNNGAAKQVQLKVDNPATIKGKVRVMARTSEDVIIYLESINDNKFTPAAKTLVAEGPENVKIKAAGAASEFPMMDQVNIAFSPHVLPVLAGSTVDFPNSDTVRHNVFGPDPIPGTDEKINLGTYDVGTIKTVNLANPGELALLCNVHAEMSGYIVAVPNPYFAVTDRKGSFTLENIPAGKYNITTWHERFKPVVMEVTVEAGQTLEGVKLPTMKKKK